MSWLLLRRFLPQLIVLAAIIAAVLYLVHLGDRKGYARRDAEAKAEAYAVDQARLAALFKHQMRTTALQRRLAEINDEVTHDLRPRLEAASARAGDLARRVLEYQSRPRGCPVSAPGAGASRADAASGESGDAEGPRGEAAAIRTAGDEVRAAAAADRAACARDAERLTGWQERELKIEAAYLAE